jgi:hypothetical protein
MNTLQGERGEKFGEKVRLEQEDLLQNEREVLSAIAQEDSPLREESIETLGSIGNRKIKEISPPEPSHLPKKGRETRSGQGAKTEDTIVQNVGEITKSQSQSFVPDVKKEILSSSPSGKWSNQSHHVLKKDNLLGSGSEKHPLTSLLSKTFVNFSKERTGLSFSGPELPSNVGPTELVPHEQLEAAVDDEETACNLQGMVFNDDELGWFVFSYNLGS